MQAPEIQRKDLSHRLKVFINMLLMAYTKEYFGKNKQENSINMAIIVAGFVPYFSKAEKNKPSEQPSRMEEKEG